MIAVCPRCAREQVTFCNIKKAYTIYCRNCGKTSKARSWIIREESINAALPPAVFVRASEIPRGNFANVADVTDKDIKITYPLDQKFEAASRKDILRWEARYCKTGASE